MKSRRSLYLGICVVITQVVMIAGCHLQDLKLSIKGLAVPGKGAVSEVLTNIPVGPLPLP